MLHGKQVLARTMLEVDRIASKEVGIRRCDILPTGVDSLTYRERHCRDGLMRAWASAAICIAELTVTGPGCPTYAAFSFSSPALNP